MIKAAQIAVVDDDSGIRDALEGTINSLGYTPRLFSSAEAFLQSPERGEVACIILDVRMSGISGLELHDILNTCGLNVPVIYMTSYGDESTRLRALSAGATGFLGKPVDDTELIACIEAALRRHYTKR